jgi:SAM-dependent methyltransferase
MKDRNNFNETFKEIEGDVRLIDPKLQKWSTNYLQGHQKRYISDYGIIMSAYGNRSGPILEIGSMPFHLTAILKKSGLPIIGLDLEPERAHGFIEKHKLEIHKCDVEKDKIPFGDSTFDLIVFNEIFEHLRINPITTLREMCRVLVPGGKLILTTPNLYALGNVWWFLTGRSIDNSPYKEYLKLQEIGHMGHVRIYSAREVKEFLENTGFRVDSVRFRYFRRRGKTFIFNFFYEVLPPLRPQLILVAEKV